MKSAEHIFSDEQLNEIGPGSERFPLYRIAKCDEILRYKLQQIFSLLWFNNKPDRVCFRMFSPRRGYVRPSNIRGQ